MKRLPIGIQTFRKLIDGNYLYVDKTEDIHKLIVQGSVYFLSRPRRFGKSLLISTLNEIFEGKVRRSCLRICGYTMPITTGENTLSSV